MSISGKALELFLSFNDREYRRAFAWELGSKLATQIRLLRERRGWRQQDLANRLGKRQEQISLLENPDYGRYSLRTLLQIAEAFDVALIVHFGSFAELAEREANLTIDRIAPPAYDDQLRTLQGSSDSRLARIPDLAKCRQAGHSLTRDASSDSRPWTSSEQAGLGHLGRLDDERQGLPTLLRTGARWAS